MMLNGLVLMAAGMGLVVTFLSLLVCVLILSAKIIPRFNHILPDSAPSPRGRSRRPPRTAASREPVASDAEIALAVAAAVARQRES